MASHRPPPSHHHSQPLPPPPNHSGYTHPHSHSGQNRLPQSSYAHESNMQNGGSSGSHSMSSSRHLPPLSQSPSYPGPPRQENNLPPLSPYSQRSYGPSQNYPHPPLSRSGSGQHPPPPGRLPPQSYSSQHHPPQVPPPLYPHPSSSSQGHWDQGPPRLEHPQPSNHHQTQRRESMDMNMSAVRRKPSMSEREPATPPELPTLVSTVPRESEESGPPASDFVKKLARMLDDQSFAGVVSWGPKGDCFVVKDMTEFTKTILPRMFKHSNFASFVRQLNKYDFHKIKNPDDTFGDQSWTFHHPDFQRSNREALENIKRKVPAQKKGPRPSAGGVPSAIPGPASPQDGAPAPSVIERNDASASNNALLQAQIDQLLRCQEDMTARLATAERNYQNVLNEMVAFQRGMAAQDSLMQTLISHFIDSAKPGSEGAGKNMSTFDGRSNLSRLATLASMGYPGSTASIDSNTTLVNPASPPDLSPVEKSILVRQETAQRLDELRRGRDPGAQPGSNEAASSAQSTAPYMTSLNPAAAAATAPMQSARTEIDPRSGMRVFSANGQIVPSSMQDGNVNMAISNGVVPVNGTSSSSSSQQQQQQQQQQQHQAQQVANQQQWTFPEDQMDTGAGDMDDGPTEAGPSNYAPNPSAGPSMALDLGASLLDSPGGSRIRLRGKVASAPGWAVPPRVLLVDDDLVSRKLFSKFLQVSGCTIDVAVDGIGAVNKMNLEKYDLVLMDIVMPKLDGVSATSLIRQFDHMTPIISMTSNSKPNDVVTYYSSGMNDILPKPFTRENLFTMLERHLGHLKAIQQLTKPGFEELAAAATQSATMALTEDQYSAMLSGLLGMSGEGDGFAALAPGTVMMGDIGMQKRSLDAMDDEREVKRPRFEVVE
ncbi:kinase-regulated stress-responsive transcription factor skn7 [Tulasnella sp. JGI-2019a]|nr:kinase-regulated stress-responsive transcription factor skn7 [Tulasnella sp. JGI-2019a]